MSKNSISRCICAASIRTGNRQPTSASFRLLSQSSYTPPLIIRNSQLPRNHRRLQLTSPVCATRSYQTAYQHFRERIGEAKKDIWQKHPILYPSMIIFIVTVIGYGSFLIYDAYENAEKRLHKFPKPVADALRKAIYYTEIDLDPTKALGWYKYALVVADRIGMHPFSDEVLGIRLQIAAMLERAGLVKAAIDVLEKARADSEQWVANGRRRQTIRDNERAISVREQRRKPQEDAVDEETLQQEKETLEAEAKEAQQRDGVMQKVQGIWLKLAELYGGEHVHDAEKMENALIQAVTVSRTEVQRRKDLNLPISTHEGKGFINLTHLATAYNELADFYVNKGRSQLAATLYMQALDLIKQEQEPGAATCAQVVLLNNISSQMAQQAQTPLPPRPDSTGPPLSRDQLLYAASEWAKKALDVAAHIKPSIRDAECDQGCQVATYNLGEIAEMRENYSEAEKHYQAARKLAVELQFEEGVQRADEALSRLKARK